MYIIIYNKMIYNIFLYMYMLYYHIYIYIINVEQNKFIRINTHLP
jgi:hypothetical protein